MAQVTVLGPWQGDGVQQQTARYAAIKQLQTAGAGFRSNVDMAHKEADALGKMIVTVMGTTRGSHGGSNKPMYALVDPARWNGGAAGGAGTGGTMGGTGGGGAAGAAAAAVQAGMPSYTGGGPSFSIGGVNESIILQQRDDEFLGVDTLTPPEKLAAGYSPYAVNWDGFARIGSRCVRRGTAKLEDDHASLSKHADLRGVSLALIPNGTADQLQLLYSFADNDIGSTRTSQATDITVVTTAPRWGRPTTLKGWQGPKLAATDAGGQVLQVVADYTNVFNNSTQRGYRANSVVALTIRRSTDGYPRDIDGFDYLHDQGTPSTPVTDSSPTLEYDRAPWKGESVTITETLTATTYYLTAWAVSREGISEPSFARVTLS